MGNWERGMRTEEARELIARIGECMPDQVCSYVLIFHKDCMDDQGKRYHAAEIHTDLTAEEVNPFLLGTVTANMESGEE